MRAVVVHLLVAIALLACASSFAAESPWWNPQWRFRTIVHRPSPYRDTKPRPVELAADFASLLAKASVSGQFDPNSLRVVQRNAQGRPSEVPSVWRAEVDGETGRQRMYLAWWTQPVAGESGIAEIYFDTTDRRIPQANYDPASLPPENLLANPSFEQRNGLLPNLWEVRPSSAARLERANHSHLQKSLKVVVDQHHSGPKDRKVSISQQIDVRKYAGQEIVFECDLLAERAPYGAPLRIQLEQFRADGSQIAEFAVQPRWLAIELAQGQLVQFCERGRLNPEAASVRLVAELRCEVRDADTGKPIEGPESYFTVWLDRFVFRPGERWPWPAATGAGFVEGALRGAPLNRGFRFTGQRCLAFNGASEGTLTSGREDPNPRSVHWGLAAGTLEFWCLPCWNAGDQAERVFFEGVAFGHRQQSRLARLGGPAGKDQLELMIVDSGRKAHKLRAPVNLEPGRWHHIAATWNFAQAQLQIFVDGKRSAQTEPGKDAWPFRLVPNGDAPGIGISESDSRSMPMQAFLGGLHTCDPQFSAEAVFDEVRVSDVARYHDDFQPQPREFAIDENTRALFHFENERHGVHQGDDQFVSGHLACELPRQEDHVTLESFQEGQIQRRSIAVRPRVPGAFDANRVERRLMVTRPHDTPPDPRLLSIEHHQQQWTVSGPDKFRLDVGGDYEPSMESITYELAPGAKATTLPHMRANHAVLPFGVDSLHATLAPDVADDAARALEAFRYAAAVTNYYDAHYCETLPARHRPRVSYTLAKAINIYPFDQCGPLNYTLRKLFLTVGISSSDSSGTHHQFQQAFYQGSWRLFDLSPRKYWLNRDDTTVCSRRNFEDDLYLKLRQEDGICSALPGRRCKAPLDSAERPHAMDFPLRPGERVSFCWHNEGRWFELTEDRRPVPLAKIPPSYGNGAIVYEPTVEGEAVDWSNLVPTVNQGRTVLRAKDPGKPGAMVYRVHCPYILSDGRLIADYEGARPEGVRVALSFNAGKTWSEAWKSNSPGGHIDQALLPMISARYDYWLKIEVAPGCAVSNLRVRTTFVASPLALPGKLKRGNNDVEFVATPGIGPVRAVCRWTQRRKADTAVSTNTIGYYLDGDRSQRNLLVTPPGAEVSLETTGQMLKKSDCASLVNLPQEWRGGSAERTDDGTVRFRLRSPEIEGQTAACEVVLGDGRRVPVQFLVAQSPLVREAERADRITGLAKAYSAGHLSQGQGVQFSGEGELIFQFQVPRPATYAMWLRSQWDDKDNTEMSLAVAGSPARSLRADAMIGFSDWTDPRQAHTKMFAHFGEQFGHWSWYRVPEIRLAAGPQTVTLKAQAGAHFDALMLLPQTEEVDPGGHEPFAKLELRALA